MGVSTPVTLTLFLLYIAKPYSANVSLRLSLTCLCEQPGVRSGHKLQFYHCGSPAQHSGNAANLLI